MRKLIDVGAALSSVILLFASASSGRAADEPSAPPDASASRRFREELGALVSAAGKKDRPFVEGKERWLFFTTELRSLSVGPFWGDHAAGVSRAANLKSADPLPAIVDFHKQLQGVGVELILVPVPAKALIYPDQISKTVTADSEGKVPRLDSAHAEFYRLLREQGVSVVDLVPEFLTARHEAQGDLFCRTDTHWSGRGCQIAAGVLAKRLSDAAWLKERPQKVFSTEARTVEITGDLARLANESQPIREKLPLMFVRESPATISRESPILLLGDSHTLVFHDPELHAQGAGLPDHLAAALGTPVDLIGVRGSGSHAARVTLLRRGDQLHGKKVVLWCFSMREFTESTDGWRTVPIRKP